MLNSCDPGVVSMARFVKGGMMTTGLKFLIPTLFTGVLLIPSDVTPLSAEASQAQAGSVDVCAALPREEAMKILGSKMLRARSRKLGEADECVYSDSVLGTITVLVQAGTSRKEFDEEIKSLREFGANIVSASGVGDTAVFYDTRLYTYARKYRIVITTTPVVRPDEAKERANAVALAKGLLARLK
jgi:hypothetical protein